jgi:hypothetical protein
MAKDPAVLFYTSDFLSGTITMNYEQRGKYITLLCIQHQQSFLTDEDFESILTENDKRVKDKFEKQSDGTYVNIKLKTESERRKSYTESRRNNRKGKNLSTSYVQLMETVTGTVTGTGTGNDTDTITDTVITSNMINRLVDKFINISDRFRFQSFLHEVKDYGGWDEFLELYSKGDTSVKKNFTNQLNQYNNGIFQNKQY